MASSDWLTDDRMKAQVEDGLIVSIDLLIRDHHGRWLLALRKNRPAQSFWFVPGGRIRKRESIGEAFERLMRFEFGVSIDYDQSQFQGVYVHYYDDNRWNEAGFGTHYLVLAHRLDFESESTLRELSDSAKALDQHHRLQWFDRASALAAPDVHPYTKIYLAQENSPSGITELFPDSYQDLLKTVG